MKKEMERKREKEARGKGYREMGKAGGRKGQRWPPSNPKQI